MQRRHRHTVASVYRMQIFLSNNFQTMQNMKNGMSSYVVGPDSF